MKRFRDEFGFTTLGWVVLAVLFVALGANAMIYASRKSCAASGARLGVVSQWDPWAGCFIYDDLNDRWLPLDEIRFVRVRPVREEMP